MCHEDGTDLVREKNKQTANFTFAPFVWSASCMPNCYAVHTRNTNVEFPAAFVLIVRGASAETATCNVRHERKRIIDVLIGWLSVLLALYCLETSL